MTVHILYCKSFDSLSLSHSLSLIDNGFPKGITSYSYYCHFVLANHPTPETSKVDFGGMGAKISVQHQIPRCSQLRWGIANQEEHTIWLFNIAMENGPFIVSFPIKNGDFPWLC
jgi:hypothetical protein